jgi:ABC-2 type transport system permease protein
VQFLFGALAFFVDQSLGLYNAWFALWSILSGYLFPLEMAPASVVPILELLPFRSMLAVPTEIAAGQLRGAPSLQAVALQAAWLVVFILIARAVWRAGVRRYEAFGA